MHKRHIHCNISGRKTNIGVALVSYYRHILPVLNIMRNRKSSNAFDQTEANDEHLSEKIDETLQLMEQYGGPDAFINIKYMIPAYESCVKNY